MAITESHLLTMQASRPARPPLFGRKFVTIYKACALLFFNTLLVFLLLNGVLALVFPVSSSAQRAPIIDKYPESYLAAVYPDFTPKERNLLLNETWNRPLLSDAYTHFIEAPYTGRYVNVTEAGYRKSIHQGPWPPRKDQVTVFVFGGSTTFGYGLPDYQTIPSYLQEALSEHVKRPVAVYNFGVGWYYLTQERIRLEKLVLHGHTPDIALFIDGMNDMYAEGRPANTEAIDVTARPQVDKEVREGFETFLRSLPMARAAKQLKKRFLGRQNWQREPPTDQRIQEHLRKFWTNQTMIRALGRQFGFTPIFVLQPCPYYHYDLKYHLFSLVDQVSPFYTAIARQVHQQTPPGDFLWCADLQESEHECLYVDIVHYNAKFSKKFADTICHLCRERRLLARYGIE